MVRRGDKEQGENKGSKGKATTLTTAGLATRDTDSDSEEVEINLDHESYGGMEQEGRAGAQLVTTEEVQEKLEPAIKEVEIMEME